MSDWVSVRAREIRQAEKEKQAERDRLEKEASALRAKVEPFWKELVGILQESVNQFNVEFPELERRIDQFEKPSASGVTIRRTVYPSAVVKAQLNNGSTSIHYTISRTLRKGTDAVEKQGNFGFGLTDGEVCYSDSAMAGHEDVARLLLDAFFQF